MPTAYAFDQATGEFLSTHQLDDSDISPREPGVYLIPAGCTLVAPPSVPVGSFATFDGAAWIVRVRPTPEPPELPEPPAVTTTDYTRAVQAALDSKARERNYDGILSACTYVTSGVPKFQAEGQVCVAWRDAVWAYCYDVLAQVQAQTIPQPTVAELVAGMPTLTWPA